MTLRNCKKFVVETWCVVAVVSQTLTFCKCLTFTDSLLFCHS